MQMADLLAALRLQRNPEAVLDCLNALAAGPSGVPDLCNPLDHAIESIEAGLEYEAQRMNPRMPDWMENESASFGVPAWISAAL